MGFGRKRGPLRRHQITVKRPCKPNRYLQHTTQDYYPDFPRISPVLTGMECRWRALLVYSIVPAANAKSLFADPVIVEIFTAVLIAQNQRAGNQ